nr:MAG TPA: hypothetical protein [Bacteriophage sp.]
MFTLCLPLGSAVPKGFFIVSLPYSDLTERFVRSAYLHRSPFFRSGSTGKSDVSLTKSIFDTLKLCYLLNLI